MSFRGFTEQHLKAAIEAQDVDAVRRVLKDRSFKVDWLKGGGKSGGPLHRACLCGQEEIVSLLLEKGSPLDARDDQGYTPLLAAASQRHFKIVKQLLDVGANSSLSNESGSSLLHYLIRTEPPLTGEQREMLEYCLHSGCDINCRNRYGETPLHQASMRRHEDMCRFLLSHGAKVDAINKFGETPLHKACAGGSRALVELITGYGADPTIQSAHGTPLALLEEAAATAQPKEDIEAAMQLLQDYEKRYERPAINLNATKPEVQILEDAMQRTKNIVGVSFQASSQQLVRRPRVPSGSGMELPKISITLTPKEEKPAPPAHRPTRPPRDKFAPRQSIISIDDYEEDEEEESSDMDAPIPFNIRKVVSVPPSPAQLRMLDPRLGAIGSGTTRSRSNSLGGSEPAILSNSPQVARLLRQPSFSKDSPIFTADSSFRQESSGFGRLDDMRLQTIPRIYRDEFHGQPHLVFMSTGGVVCVQETQTRNSFGVLVFEAIKGFEKMAIPALQMEGAKDFVSGCLNWIALNVFPKADIWLVEDDAELKAELHKIEASAPESSSCYRIGVVYCAENQKTEAEFFTNPTDIPAFKDFLGVIGEEIELQGWGGYRGQLSVTSPGTSYYVQFKGAEVMFHVSTLMDPEQHRRLIGNDTAIIYFHDSETKPFPSDAPRSIMGQVFAVVKPHDKGKKLKFGIMSRKTVAEFGPEMPMNPVFDVMTQNGREVFRSFLLAKVLNGYRSATLSPPLDKMLKRPRVVIIGKLVERFPMANTKKKHYLKAGKLKK